MRFMNLNKWNGQGHQEENKGGEGDNNNGGGGVLTAAEIQTMITDGIKAGIEAHNKPAEGDDKDKDKSAYQKQLDAQKLIDDAAASDKTKTDGLRSEIAFDGAFDKLITDNKDQFKNDSAFFRTAVNGLNPTETVHALKVMAAQDYFSKDENLALLTATDKAFISASVVGQHERNVDSTKAWSVFESALNVSTRLNLANNMNSNNSGQGGESGTPLLDAFIEKAKNRVRGVKAV